MLAFYRASLLHSAYMIWQFSSFAYVCLSVTFWFMLNIPVKF